MKSGVEQKQGRLVLVGHSHLQHIPGNHGRPPDLACSKTSEALSERWVPRIRPRDEERVANELKLKLSIQVSPRTVGKYLRNDRPTRTPDPKQLWRNFVPNHAKINGGLQFLRGDHCRISHPLCLRRT
jgi:hypothetical protein